MTAVEGLSEFRDKFRVDDLTVIQTASWTWSVRPLQTTIGAGILSANRYVERFGDLSQEEGSDLLGAISVVERTLRQVYQYDKINYLMLMMVDPHVHFHVIPRYGRTIEFAGHEWVDSAWPTPPAMGDNEDKSTPDLLSAVRDALRDGIPGA